LCTFDGSEDDVIHVAVTLLSGCAFIIIIIIIIIICMHSLFYYSTDSSRSLFSHSNTQHALK